jgi:uncharacterized membrane protein
MARVERAPLIASGIVLGAGLGGFADGILFHQVLQFHNMLSGPVPVVDLASAKVNMFWDGIFHASVWLMTGIGLVMLFRAGRRRDVPWSGRILSGAMLMGWGGFNLIEGVVDHLILGLHHVYEYTLHPLPADLAFLASGLLLIGTGWGLIFGVGARTAPRGEGIGAALGS